MEETKTELESQTENQTENSTEPKVKFNYKNILVVAGVLIAVVFGFVLLLGNQNEEQSETEIINKTETISEGGEAVEELKIEDLLIGEGAEAKSGNTVSVHYTGTLTDGTKFDSSLDRGDPFEFNLGAGQVIAGWDQGVVGMKVGGKRKLTIPSELGYGERGAGASIPPNATLVFEIELLEVR